LLNYEKILNRITSIQNASLLKIKNKSTKLTTTNWPFRGRQDQATDNTNS